jgi:hypothetical protein
MITIKNPTIILIVLIFNEVCDCFFLLCWVYCFHSGIDA